MTKKTGSDSAERKRAKSRKEATIAASRVKDKRTRVIVLTASMSRKVRESTVVLISGDWSIGMCSISYNRKSKRKQEKSSGDFQGQECKRSAPCRNGRASGRSLEMVA